MGSTIVERSPNVTFPARIILPGADATKLANDSNSHWQGPPERSHGIPRTGTWPAPSQHKTVTGTTRACSTIAAQDITMMNASTNRSEMRRLPSLMPKYIQKKCFSQPWSRKPGEYRRSGLPFLFP